MEHRKQPLTELIYYLGLSPLGLYPLLSSRARELSLHWGDSPNTGFPMFKEGLLRYKQSKLGIFVLAMMSDSNSPAAPRARVRRVSEQQKPLLSHLSCIQKSVLECSLACLQKEIIQKKRESVKIVRSD